MNMNKTDTNTYYQVNNNDITSYILELQFGDQTQDVNANQILRNINFVIACNIWLFIHDENDEDKQWNIMLSLNDDEKDIAFTHLNQSSHQYKATKYKITNSSVFKTVSRIPKALTIGVQTCINQTTSSAECILIGSVLVIVSNVVMTKKVVTSTEASAKSIAQSTLLIPLRACASLAAGAIGGACSIAAVPIQTVGTAGLYVYNGTNTNDVINWKEMTHVLPSFRKLINWASNNFTEISIQKSSFKKNNSFEKRVLQSQRLLNQYPDRIPVICEPGVIYRNRNWDISKQELQRTKTKYLVPSDLTVGQMAYVIRKRIKLAPEEAMFLFVDNTLPSTASLMSEIYQNDKDKDGFLYFTYNGENCYGTL